MPAQSQLTVEDQVLRNLERSISGLPDFGVPPEVTDPRVRRYLGALPPHIASKLVSKTIEMRRALSGAITVLDSLGYTVEAYCGLDEVERDAPPWQAVRAAWEASGRGPKYFVRYTSGSKKCVGVYRTYRDALEAALETIEGCSGYPEVIEMEGGTVVMNQTAILKEWEERHDPG